MSALARPLIHTVSSDAAVSAVVNAEHIHAVSTNNVPSATPNGVNEFFIYFSVLATDGQLKSVEWKYSESATAEADRDTDFGQIIAAISLAV